MTEPLSPERPQERERIYPRLVERFRRFKDEYAYPLGAAAAAGVFAASVGHLIPLEDYNPTVCEDPKEWVGHIPPHSREAYYPSALTPLEAEMANRAWVPIFTAHTELWNHPGVETHSQEYDGPVRNTVSRELPDGGTIQLHHDLSQEYLDGKSHKQSYMLVYYKDGMTSANAAKPDVNLSFISEDASHYELIGFDADGMFAVSEANPDPASLMRGIAALDSLLPQLQPGTCA